jgi:putative membrane protein
MKNASSVIAGVAAALSLGLGACAHQQEEVVQARPANAQRQRPSLPPVQGVPSPLAAQPEVPPPQEAVEKLPQPDRDFLRQAVAANATALRFGQLAAHRGASVEVRSLGREMVDTNTGLRDQLRQSANTVGVALPIPAMTPDQTRMYDELATLSGEEFDKAFLRAVIAIQQETIASFENEIRNGKISELGLLANATLPLLKQRHRSVQNQIRRM